MAYSREFTYKTLAELKAAFDSGELNREEHVLMLDNDNVSMYDEATDTDLFGDVLPEDLLEQALDLLGIKHEHV